ncbi:MAG: conjugative transfer relaxase/helicase TraI [Sodalis sp. (in: enterobacteria)]|uniref:conjugative transfer relaxase/helicase TraI n=1 Tax=Sodalis sp. (in: enterobacteria) TaxID=1898979 RepID=UPI0039E6E746
MMSFSQVRSAGMASSYYTQQDNYYVLGSVGDRWYGKGAEMLGLRGPVESKTFTAVLEGRLPDGSDLTFLKAGKNQHRPGYDLTFSAPKSVSLMAMLGGDKRLIDAHHQAVNVALGQVERLAAVRSMKEGQSTTVLTGNIVAALFNHDTSRELDPQLHTHAVVANVTRHGDRWQALASDRVGKTGFSEMVLANQIALGQLYRHTLRQQVETMGYRVEVVGKHGLWEMVDVPTAAFSKRSQAIDAAAGEGASLKSRDVATLDTRRNKARYDPLELVNTWRERLKATGFDMAAYRAQATENTLSTPLSDVPASISPEQVQTAVGQALSLLADRQTQFSYAELLSQTVSQLPAEPGVFDAVRKGIDVAIEQQRIIPLDREKGALTSDIHLLNELTLRELVQQQRQQGVVVRPERLPALDATQAAVRQWVTDGPPVAVLSGLGGASVRCERVAELVSLSRAQGREVQIMTPDRHSAAALSRYDALDATPMATRQRLTDPVMFVPNSTLIVDQAEKFTLKEMVTLTGEAMRHNVQLVLMDNQQRKGTGNALSVLREAAPVYRYQTTQTVGVAVYSDADKVRRFERLARDYVRTLGQGLDCVAQVSGPRDQQALVNCVREALKTQGELGRAEQTMTMLTPVWLSGKQRTARDSYRAGMVMERWDDETKTRSRFVIDRVAPQTNTLLLNRQGERRLEKISQLDSRWSLYQPGVLPVSDGERIRVLAREAEGKLQAGDNLRARLLPSGEVKLSGVAKKSTLTVMPGGDVFSALKLGQGYVEGLGASVSATARVFAAVTQRDLDQPTLNQLARSGEKVVLYSAVEKEKTLAKLARNPHYQSSIEQLQTLTGETTLAAALAHQKAGLYTPTEQALSLAVTSLERQGLAFSYPALLAEAVTFGKTSADDVERTIASQVKRGELIAIDVAPGFGTHLLVARTSFENEKSILRHMAEGKDAVAPLMTAVPPETLRGLTAGQQAATRLILETPDRFVLVQGYAGVGKTTQFRAVLDALATLPERQRPQVIGLAPTHRSVGEMQAAGVNAQTLASFLYDEGQKTARGEQVNYANTLFVVDEASMIGNAEMAKACALIASCRGRAVVSGDSAQLQPVAAGQPFRLQQGRSAADMAVMKEIVRQTQALKPAIYRMIAGDSAGALVCVAQVTPQSVPRAPGAWIHTSSVMEIAPQKKGENACLTPQAASTPDRGRPESVRDAIVQDYLGRTPSARDTTLIITHLNDDRRAINAAIHDARAQRGELEGEAVVVPVLMNTNLPEGALRKLATWEAHRTALALKGQRYWQIADIDTKSDTVTLRDTQGRTQTLSPREASREGITLYQTGTVTVSVGDRMRFSKSDSEQGFVANSVWQVQSVNAETLVLSDGRQTRTLMPGKEKAHGHIDLAYAVTAHGAQGASEAFVIALEGTEGGRRQMVNPASAYVALSRAKQHVQVYTDNRAAWLSALDKTESGGTAHDILMQSDDRQRQQARTLLAQGKPLASVAQGRALLAASGLTGESLGQFVRRGKTSPQFYVALPVYDANGKGAGVWLAPLGRGGVTTDLWGSGRARREGSEDAVFAALQRSQNGETRMATSMTAGIRLAAAHPHSGVVVRLSGQAVPHNPRAMTGGKLWADIPAGAGTSPPLPDLPPVPQDGLAEMRRALEKQAEKVAKAFGQKTASPALRPESINAILSRTGKTPDTPTPEQVQAIQKVATQPVRQPDDAAVRQVVHENLQRERLHQFERELVRDREKLLGE